MKTATTASSKEELLKKKTVEAEKLAAKAKEYSLKAEKLAAEALALAKEVEQEKTNATVSLSSKEGSDSSSSSDSSDNEDESVKKTVAPEKQATVEKHDSSSDSSDSEDSDSDDDDDADKMKGVELKKEVSKVAKKQESSSESDSSGSDSDGDTDEKVVSKNAKVETSEDGSSSSESSSDSDDSEDEEELDKEEPKKRKNSISHEEPAPKRAAVTDANDITKIYVRGLPWRAEAHKVEEFFASCGTIVSCELPLQDDGRSSGTAIVEFSDSGAAASAVELNGNDFEGRWLSIKYSTPKPILSPRVPTEKQEGCVTVFCGNLSWDVDEDTMRQAFGSCGEIAAVRFATDKETGDFKGFGHIEFTETEATDKAIALSGTEILGRAVRVDFANDKRKEGGFTPGGRGGRGGRGYMGRGGGGRGGRGRGRGGGFGGRGGSDASRAKRSGAIAGFSGKKITFE